MDKSRLTGKKFTNWLDSTPQTKWKTPALIEWKTLHNWVENTPQTWWKTLHKLGGKHSTTGWKTLHNWVENTPQLGGKHSTNWVENI